MSRREWWRFAKDATEVEVDELVALVSDEPGQATADLQDRLGISRPATRQRISQAHRDGRIFAQLGGWYPARRNAEEVANGCF